MDWFKSIFLLVTVINFHIKSTYQNDLIVSILENSFVLYKIELNL